MTRTIPTTSSACLTHVHAHVPHTCPHTCPLPCPRTRPHTCPHTCPRTRPHTSVCKGTRVHELRHNDMERRAHRGTRTRSVSPASADSQCLGSVSTSVQEYTQSVGWPAPAVSATISLRFSANTHYGRRRSQSQQSVPAASASSQSQQPVPAATGKQSASGIAI